MVSMEKTYKKRDKTCEYGVEYQASNQGIYTGIVNVELTGSAGLTAAAALFPPKLKELKALAEVAKRAMVAANFMLWICFTLIYLF